MKIFVTGASGQLGSDVIRELEANNMDYIGVSSKLLNITNRDAVIRAINAYHPDAVVHCASYTRVDQAEDEPERCFAVNESGTENIALACREISAKMLYISTDYVFDGLGTDFYETDSTVNPINTYGMSKLKGEESVRRIMDKYFILRTSWFFGVNGANFVKTILSLAAAQAEVSVVYDRIGSPTFSADLAALICKMIQTDRYGVYHGTNEGICSWADLASAAIFMMGMNASVKRITGDMYKTKAKRPNNSRLSKRSLDEGKFKRLPHWSDALSRYIKILKEK